MRNESVRDESDHLARITRLYAIAARIFGSRAEAERWMDTPNRGLDGARPADEFATEAAARNVEDLLGRIEYGIFG